MNCWDCWGGCGVVVWKGTMWGSFGIALLLLIGSMAYWMEMTDLHEPAGCNFLF